MRPEDWAARKHDMLPPPKAAAPFSSEWRVVVDDLSPEEAGGLLAVRGVSGVVDRVWSGWSALVKRRFGWAPDAVKANDLARSRTLSIRNMTKALQVKSESSRLISVAQPQEPEMSRLKPLTEDKNLCSKCKKAPAENKWMKLCGSCKKKSHDYDKTESEMETSAFVRALETITGLSASNDVSLAPAGWLPPEPEEFAANGIDEAHEDGDTPDNGDSKNDRSDPSLDDRILQGLKVKAWPQGKARPTLSALVKALRRLSRDPDRVASVLDVDSQERRKIRGAARAQKRYGL